MENRKFSDAQILAALLRWEAGIPPVTLCLELQITRKTFEDWRTNHAKALHQVIADRETEALLGRMGVRKRKRTSQADS